MNVRKFNRSELGHVLKHFSRETKPGHYSNTDIDFERTELNINYGPDRDETQMEYINQMLDRIDHVDRKDLVVMGSIIVDAPATLSDSMHDRFFELSYKFLTDRYGSIAGFENHEDVVVSCYRHRDETTDHIHYAFCPIKMDADGHQRFIAKEVISRDDLRTLHQDLSRYLSESGCYADVLNGSTKFDANGRALSVRELKAASRKREREYSRTEENFW